MQAIQIIVATNASWTTVKLKLGDNFKVIYGHLPGAIPPTSA